MMFEHLHRLSERHEFHAFSYSDANHDFADIRPFLKENHIIPFNHGKIFNSPLGRLNQFVRWMDLKRMQSIERKMAADMENEGFDMVWVHPSQIQNSPALLQYLTRIPTIFYCQEPLRILYEQMPARPYDRHESSLRTLANKIDLFHNLFFTALKRNDQRNIRSANHIMVNSNFIRSMVAQIYDVQPVTNYGGVNLDFFQPLGLQKEDYLFAVGSMTPLKGFDFIVRALATIPEKQRLPLVIASNFANPPERFFLQQLAEELHVTVKLETGISDEELRNHYNRTKLTVCASIREPFGLVPIEAMACGSPVLAVAEGGFLESIDDQVTGVLALRDESTYGAAISNLIRNEDKLKYLGNNGLKSVHENWSWQHSAERFANLLEDYVHTA